MRCRPGDLAVVIGYLHLDANLGMLVDVLRPAVPGQPVAHGTYQGTGEGWVIRRAGGGKMKGWNVLGFPMDVDEACIKDCHLMPIRDPGDDAKDELLRPLPQEVTA